MNGVNLVVAAVQMLEHYWSVVGLNCYIPLAVWDLSSCVDQVSPSPMSLEVALSWGGGGGHATSYCVYICVHVSCVVYMLVSRVCGLHVCGACFTCV